MPVLVQIADAYLGDLRVAGLTGFRHLAAQVQLSGESGAVQGDPYGFLISGSSFQGLGLSLFLPAQSGQLPGQGQKGLLPQVVGVGIVAPQPGKQPDAHAVFPTLGAAGYPVLLQGKTAPAGILPKNLAVITPAGAGSVQHPFQSTLGQLSHVTPRLPCRTGGRLQNDPAQLPAEAASPDGIYPGPEDSGRQTGSPAADRSVM